MVVADGTNYAQQDLALKPPGALWRAMKYAPVLGGLRQAIGDFFASIHADIDRLDIETDPRRTQQLLPEWEASVGLPDGCLPEGGTVDQRRNALVARLKSTGGANAHYFIQLGAIYGYTLTIEELGPAQIRVRSAQALAISNFRAGTGRAGERLRTWGNTQLECLINRVKPAHVTVVFAYGAS